jgi:hypothetical protein
MLRPPVLAVAVAVAVEVVVGIKLSTLFVDVSDHSSSNISVWCALRMTVFSMASSRISAV